jgi:hypothetical protein
LSRSAESKRRLPLDARLPEQSDLTGELAWSGAALRDSLAEVSTPSWNARRYGLSARWQVAEGFRAAAALLEQSTQTPTSNWPQRRAGLEATSARLAASSNPVSAAYGYHLSSAERTLRCTLARMRQLRAAIELHLAQELPPLADPLGSGPFTVVAGNPVTTLRSAEGFGNQQIERMVQR